MADRAASEVLGFALVFGLVITSVAIVSVAGLGSLQSTRDAEQLNNAERAFDVLSDNMADMYERGAPSRATEVALGNGQLYTGDNVTINVTVVDSGSTKTITRTVRPIIYRGNNDGQLVYEGGAIFREERESGLVNEQPPIQISDDRAYIQIIAARSANTESAGGSTVLVRSNKQSSKLAIHDNDQTYDEIYVNVTSPRADLWGEFLAGTSLSEHKTNEDIGTSEEFVTYSKDSPTQHVSVVVHEMTVTIER